VLLSPQVPKQKWETQKKRSAYSKAAAYPAGTKIEDHGVDGAPLDLRRFLVTRELRKDAWDYFMNNIHRSSHFQFAALPKDLIVIINHVQSGPFVMGVEDGKLRKAVQMKEYFHDHGESDISVWYWLMYENARPRSPHQTPESHCLLLRSLGTT